MGDVTLDSPTSIMYGSFHKELAMQSALSVPHFHSEEAAFAFVEARLWADGRMCPHCGIVDNSGALNGKTNRVGLYKCYACRKPFTVRMGTLFESSHVKLNIWLQAIYMICSSKKGISTRQLQRTFGGSLKTAWFLGHRIREAMRTGELAPMGGAGGIVEIDETYIGRKEGFEVRQGGWHKNAVLTLVERGGAARSFHIENATKEQIVPIVRKNVARENHVMTDEANRYSKMGNEYASHGVVDHSRGEYGYTDRLTGMKINTNTVEGYYSIFKRGMIGIYQHCSEKHLLRYLAEFDFRYSYRIKTGYDDAARADRALLGVKGKRLTYKTTADHWEP
jgi:transposase-like protein